MSEASLEEFEDSICEECPRCKGVGEVTLLGDMGLRYWCPECGGAKLTRDAVECAEYLPVDNYYPPCTKTDPSPMRRSERSKERSK